MRIKRGVNVGRVHTLPRARKPYRGCITRELCVIVNPRNDHGYRMHLAARGVRLNAAHCLRKLEVATGHSSKGECARV